MEKQYEIECHNENGELLEHITVEGYDNAVSVYGRLKSNVNYYKVTFKDLEFFSRKQLH